jgi:Ca2+-binding EF-hand superfamily protein
MAQQEEDEEFRVTLPQMNFQPAPSRNVSSNAFSIAKSISRSGLKSMGLTATVPRVAVLSVSPADNHTITAPQFDRMQTKQKPGSRFDQETEKVFNWLDDRKTGSVTDQQLSSYLKISRVEARALIDEAKIALYGEPSDYALTLSEFRSIMIRGAQETSGATGVLNPNHLTEKQLKRYRAVFNSIDTDGSGTISPKELGVHMGISDVGAAREVFAEAGFAMKDELTFDDLVLILQSAERNQSGRAIMKLVGDSDKGAGIAAAACRRSWSVKRSAPSAVISQPAEIPPLVTTIWQQSNPSSLNLVSVDALRNTLLSAHARGDVLCNEEDLLQIMWSLCEVADTESNITFDQFWTALSQHLEVAPAVLSRTMSGSSVTSSALHTPFDALSTEEYQIVRDIFDCADPDNSGVASIPALHVQLMQSIQTPALPVRMRQCIFAILENLDATGEAEVEFELFVTIIHEACLATGAEIIDLGADMTTAPKLTSKKSRKSFRP